MATVADHLIQSQLRGRRQQLERAVKRVGPLPDMTRLLAEVDAALQRFADGTYGLCEVCHDTIEADRLGADPLLRLCLDHLSQPERRALELDLEMARRIQSALLPQPELRLPGWDVHYCYQPLGAVSGDTCDLVRAGSSGEFHLLFGDVAGKGVAASLLMANLQAIFRTLAGTGLPLEELMERANHIFCEATLPSSYATLVCARGWADGRLEVCNAGHCPPLLLRNGAVEALPPTGLPLGLFCDGGYQPEKIRLAPGDAVVFYTDGFSEAQNSEGEEFGAERLSRVLEHLPTEQGASDMVATALGELRAFTNGAPLHDDLTLMVVKCAGTVS